MKQSRVSIIITTYNSEVYIKNCINSLLNISYKPAEIIVVDNNSTDCTKKILAEYGDKIRTVFLEENFGYALANNKGIASARGDYIFIANPDIIVKPNFLERLVLKMEEDQRIAACQPLVYLLQKKEIINLTGKITHFLGFDWIRDYRSKIPPSEGEIFSFSGSGVLLRKSILKTTNVFDPFYFMYYEDSDLSWRLRLFGYKLWFIPQSIIYHDYKYIPNEHYQSMKRKLFYNERNRLITILKNYSTHTLLLLLPIVICMELALLIYSFISGWGAEKVRAYQSIIQNWNYIMKERERNQNQRQINDGIITKPFVSSLSFIYFSIPIVSYIINPLLSLYWFIIHLFI